MNSPVLRFTGYPTKHAFELMLRRNGRKGSSRRKPFGSGAAGSAGPAAGAVAYAARQQVLAPRERSSQGARRISHRELVAAVSDAASFTVTSYSLNPGMAATFPWLSTQASGFEQYRFHSLHFNYITRAATTQTGSVLFAPDYDAADAAPATYAAAATYFGAVEDAQWKDITISFDPEAMHPLGPRKFIRSAAVAGDIKTYDAGQLHVGVFGTGTNPIGYLWVEYDVELCVPQTDSGAAAGGATRSWYGRTTAQTITGAAGVVFSDAAPQIAQDGLGIGTPASGVFTLPAGVYCVEYSFTTTNDSLGTLKAINWAVLDGAAVAGSYSMSWLVNATGASAVVTTTKFIVTAVAGGSALSFRYDSSASSGNVSLVASHSSVVFTVV